MLCRRNPRGRRLLRIRDADGARHVAVMSWEAYIASSRGYDARGAFAAAAHRPWPQAKRRNAPSASEGGSACYVFGLPPVLSQDSQK